MCAVPNQKTQTVAHVLVEELVPLFGVPEALLSDRGTNLLSHLMQDLCKMLGITKLNTTAYHPECDGMVERFNRTLKAMLHKHAARFGKQWDQYLSCVLWAYRNTPHESTGEKPSFLLFGWDLRSPTEAAFMKPADLVSSTVEDYREEVMLSLSSARELAVESVQKAQKRYKKFYDRDAKQIDYRVGDWIFIRFPADESGKGHKLSHPWHGPYRILARKDPDVTATKVYFPQEGHIQVHQQRVTKCPPELVTGYYWYGSKQRSEGKIPQWIERLSEVDEADNTETQVADADEVDPQEIEDTGIDGAGLESGSMVEISNTDVQEDPRRESDLIAENADTVVPQPARMRNTDDKCPYSLRRRIITPQKYRQARDEL